MKHDTKHRHPSGDKPIGAPHVHAEKQAEPQRAFEIGDTSKHEQPAQPIPRKPMPTWKKVFVIFFSIVCAFGVYDTFFPSKNSLQLDDLLPKVISPTVTMAPVSPTPIASPSAIKNNP